jgi:folate-binding protein YgfZ
MADALSSASSSPLAELPAAILGSTGVARAYGNTFSEQRALHIGTAVVDLSDRGIIQLSGPDRLSWLDSLLSQRLDNLRAGESAEALLLDPHGHVQHAMRIVEDGENTWLLVDEGTSAALTAWLIKMRFMKQVDIIDRSLELATLGYFGQAVPAALSPLVLNHTGTAVVWQDPWNHVSEGGWQYSVEHPAHEWNYAEAVVPRDALGVLAQEVQEGNLTLAGTDALEALRIAAWRPRMATEADENALPHEFDWLRSAVHLNKGCYRGQETVAKVHNLGHPPRRIVFLSLDGIAEVLPQHADPVLEGENEVGHITAAARH